MNNNKKNKIKELIMTFLRFCVVGLTNTIVGYLIYILVIFFLRGYQSKYDYIIANIVSFLLSVLWSFFWNNRVVFKEVDGEKRSLLKSLIKTYISYGFSGIILTNGLSYLWINIFHISKTIVPLLCLPITIPLNFLLNKVWAFKSYSSSAETEGEE